MLISAHTFERARVPEFNCLVPRSGDDQIGLGRVVYTSNGFVVDAKHGFFLRNKVIRFKRLVEASAEGMIGIGQAAVENSVRVFIRGFKLPGLDIVQPVGQKQ